MAFEGRYYRAGLDGGRGCVVRGFEAGGGGRGEGEGSEGFELGFGVLFNVS